MISNIIIFSLSVVFVTSCCPIKAGSAILIPTCSWLFSDVQTQLWWLSSVRKMYIRLTQTSVGMKWGYFYYVNSYRLLRTSNFY